MKNDDDDDEGGDGGIEFSLLNYRDKSFYLTKSTRRNHFYGLNQCIKPGNIYEIRCFIEIRGACILIFENSTKCYIHI